MCNHLFSGWQINTFSYCCLCSIQLSLCMGECVLNHFTSDVYGALFSVNLLHSLACCVSVNVQGSKQCNLVRQRTWVRAWDGFGCCPKHCKLLQITFPCFTNNEMIWAYKVEFSLLPAYGKSWITWERLFLKDPSRASLLAVV